MYMTKPVNIKTGRKTDKPQNLKSTEIEKQDAVIDTIRVAP